MQYFFGMITARWTRRCSFREGVAHAARNAARARLSALSGRESALWDKETGTSM